MRDVWRKGHVPLLQIHDELCFSIRNKDQANDIAQTMIDAVKLKVPMRVDVEIGGSWAGE
jgi:DNA polymerase I-like protein with 3'-5' exonuclease and polymerase domains